MWMQQVGPPGCPPGVAVGPSLRQCPGASLSDAAAGVHAHGFCLVCLSVCLSVYLSICLIMSGCLPACLPARPPACLPASLPVWPAMICHASVRRSDWGHNNSTYTILYVYIAMIHMSQNRHHARNRNATGAVWHHRAPADTVGHPIELNSFCFIYRFELFELKFINPSFSSMSSCWNWTNSSLSSNSRQVGRLEAAVSQSAVPSPFLR